jgi:hypothetical protein
MGRPVAEYVGDVAVDLFSGSKYSAGDLAGLFEDRVRRGDLVRHREFLNFVPCCALGFVMKLQSAEAVGRCLEEACDQFKHPLVAAIYEVVKLFAIHYVDLLKKLYSGEFVLRPFHNGKGKQAVVRAAGVVQGGGGVLLNHRRLVLGGSDVVVVAAELVAGNLPTLARW